MYFDFSIIVCQTIVMADFVISVAWWKLWKIRSICTGN